MLDVREIEQEIAEIEHAKNHSPSACMYLAALYMILDHKKDPARDYKTIQYSQTPITYSQAALPREEHPVISAKVEISGNSEFMRSIGGKDAKDIWKVVDELMDDLKLGNRRVYDMVMAKIRAL